MPSVPRPSRARAHACALACATALALAACGDGDGAGRGGERTTTSRDGRGSGTPLAGARTGAADLRGTLAQLLAEHAAGSAFALNAALAEGLDGPAAAAARRSLDATARRLATVVGARAGDATGRRFLEVWRAQNGAAVDYAKARAADDATSEAIAEQRLDALRDELGELLEDEGVSRRLRPLTRDVLDAADAAVRGSDAFYDQLRRAGVRSAPLSAPLSAALVRRAGARADGAPDAPAAQLRARLTTLVVGHVELVGTAAGAGAAAGFASPQYRAAAAALDRSSRSVAGAFGDVHGARAERRFLSLWRAHVGMLTTYANAQSDGDRAAARRAREELEGWRRRFAVLVSDVVPTLPAGAVTQELEPYVNDLAAAIRAAVKRSPRTFARLHDAAARAEAAAALLADGIARQMPERFPSG